MSDKSGARTSDRPSPGWPAEPRAFVAYRPPFHKTQPARAGSPREAWADAQRFLARVGKPLPGEAARILVRAERWSAASAHTDAGGWHGEWPAGCTDENFAAAVRAADERFGTPSHRAGKRHARGMGLEESHAWLVPVDRVDEVFDYLESVPTCTTGGDYSPVQASYSVLFTMRDLATGEVLPEQGPRYQQLQSWLTINLSRGAIRLLLTLPFAEPDRAAADYAVALQEHAPVWIDPRYFDHYVPDLAAYRHSRRRLPPEWLGTTPQGEPRLDASRSGLTPEQIELPSAEEIAADPREGGFEKFHASGDVVEAALADNRAAAILIRAPYNANVPFLVEHAARRAGLPLEVLDAEAARAGESMAATLRAVLASIGDRPAVLLIPREWVPRRRSAASVARELATRVIDGVRLPKKLRLVVAMALPPDDALRAAFDRAGLAHVEGFATREQIAFLQRQSFRAASNAVRVELIQPSGR